MDIKLTQKARLRRSKLEALGWCGGSVLEIGPLDNPTFLPNEGDIRYFDIAKKEGLQSIHAHRNAERMVEIDYVLGEKIDRRFDLVVANHVVEHVPDLIQWLNDLAEITNCLFLSAPDRRYTFDFHRQLTDVIEVIRAHEDGLQRPSWHQIARARYFQIERGDPREPPGARPKRDLRDIIARSKRAAMTRYVDVHCWVYTFDSFPELIRELNEAGYVPWRVEGALPVELPACEFHALLRHG